MAGEVIEAWSKVAVPGAYLVGFSSIPIHASSPTSSPLILSGWCSAHLWGSVHPHQNSRLTPDEVRFVPEWLIPGGGFQRHARETKEKAFVALNTPFERVVAEMARSIIKFRLRLLNHYILIGARNCSPFLCIEHPISVGSRLWHQRDQDMCWIILFRYYSLCRKL